MANVVKAAFLRELTERLGALHKMSGSQSLYEVGGGAARIYIRYSTVHKGNSTFYGLRDEDLHRLDGHLAFVCFLWDGQDDPLVVPYADYEEVFRSTSPAGDGQYKIQVYLEDEGADLYIARVGRFSVEGYFGWDRLNDLIGAAGEERIRGVAEGADALNVVTRDRHIGRVFQF